MYLLLLLFFFSAYHISQSKKIVGIRTIINMGILKIATLLEYLFPIKKNTENKYVNAAKAYIFSIGHIRIYHKSHQYYIQCILTINYYGTIFFFKKWVKFSFGLGYKFLQLEFQQALKPSYFSLIHLKKSLVALKSNYAMCALCAYLDQLQSEIVI